MGTFTGSGASDGGPMGLPTYFSSRVRSSSTAASAMGADASAPRSAASMVSWHANCHDLAPGRGMVSAKSEARQSSGDGRQRRAERSREAIVSALFELVGEGVLEPTAQEVAERAGVGIRSVFRHFDDKDGLFATMDARLRRDALPILREEVTAGSLRERARALVDQRARLFERIAPY